MDWVCCCGGRSFGSKRAAPAARAPGARSRARPTRCCATSPSGSSSPARAGSTVPSPASGVRRSGSRPGISVSKDEFIEATTDVWEIAAERATRVGHPAPFPVELPLRLIELYTYGDDLVLDPFMGSGTTGVAAVRDRPAIRGVRHRDVVRRDRRAEDPRRTGPPDAQRRPRGAGDDHSIAPSAAGGGHAAARPKSARTSWPGPGDEGHKARELAREILDHCGFVDIGDDVRAGDGVEVSFSASDRDGPAVVLRRRRAHSRARGPACGGPTPCGGRSGKAAVVHAVASRHSLRPRHHRRPASAGQRRRPGVAGPGRPEAGGPDGFGAVFDVIEMESADGRARLRRLRIAKGPVARGMGPPCPMTARRSPNWPRPWACSPYARRPHRPGARPGGAGHPRRHLGAARPSSTAPGRFADEFATAFANGRAFLEAADALRGRPPRLIEWTGGRRPPGDEVAPVDLRIDHVYLVSCKYLSRNIANPSPARLFEGLLATAGEWEQTDWYLRTAPDEYRALYDAVPGGHRPRRSARRPRQLGTGRPPAPAPGPAGRSYPVGAQDPYRALCTQVSTDSARRWRDNVARAARRGAPGLAAVAHRQRHLLPPRGRRQAIVAAPGGQPLGLAPGLRLPRPRHPARPGRASPRSTGRWPTATGPRPGPGGGGPRRGALEPRPIRPATGSQDLSRHRHRRDPRLLRPERRAPINPALGLRRRSPIRRRPGVDLRGHDPGSARRRIRDHRPRAARWRCGSPTSPGASRAGPGTWPWPRPRDWGWCTG